MTRRSVLQLLGLLLCQAGTIGQTQAPVFEAGIANVTKDETPMLVHDAQGQSRQVTLVRMPPLSDDPSQGRAAPQP